MTPEFRFLEETTPLRVCILIAAGLRDCGGLRMQSFASFAQRACTLSHRKCKRLGGSSCTPLSLWYISLQHDTGRSPCCSATWTECCPCIYLCLSAVKDHAHEICLVPRREALYLTCLADEAIDICPFCMFRIPPRRKHTLALPVTGNARRALALAISLRA